MVRIIIMAIILSVFMNLSAGIYITKSEAGVVSQEIYQKNKYLQLEDAKVVSIWDFTKKELTMLDNVTKIYSVVSLEELKSKLKEQTDKEIALQRQKYSDDQRREFANRVKMQYANLQTAYRLVDTTQVANQTSFKYEILNKDLILQEIWISKDLLAKISKEVDYNAMKEVENVIKDIKMSVMRAMDLDTDPVTRMTEEVEAKGFVVKRMDYPTGKRPMTSLMQKEKDEVSDKVTKVENKLAPAPLFAVPQGYKKVSYDDYMVNQQKQEKEDLKK